MRGRASACVRKTTVIRGCGRVRARGESRRRYRAGLSGRTGSSRSSPHNWVRSRILTAERSEDASQPRPRSGLREPAPSPGCRRGGARLRHRPDVVLVDAVLGQGAMSPPAAAASNSQRGGRNQPAGRDDPGPAPGLPAGRDRPAAARRMRANRAPMPRRSAAPSVRIGRPRRHRCVDPPGSLAFRTSPRHYWR